jgi:hypothetical protein
MKTPRKTRESHEIERDLAAQLIDSYAGKLRSPHPFIYVKA